MEDTSGEWEIADYSCVEDEKETEEKQSKLGWALRTGVSIGKKFVVAGFVVSSLPIVLPPLLVISALGVACSVPFGIVFASYACTEKVMSKLLPAPPAVLPHEQDEEEEGGRVVDIEKEEKEQREAMKDEIEMRIELDGGVQDDIRAVDKESNILDSSEVDAKMTNRSYGPASRTPGLAISDDAEIVIGSLDVTRDESRSGEDVVAVLAVAPNSEVWTDSAMVNEDVIAVVPVSEVQTNTIVKNEDAIAVLPVSEVEIDTTGKIEDVKDVKSRKQKEQISVLEEDNKRAEKDKKRGKRVKRGKRKEPEGEKREDERKEEESSLLEETMANDLVMQGGLGVADNKRSPDVDGGQESGGELSADKEDRGGSTLGSKLGGEEQRPVDSTRRGFAPGMHGDMNGQGSMISGVLASERNEDKSGMMISDDAKTSMLDAATTGSTGLEYGEKMHSVNEGDDASAVDGALHSDEDKIWKQIDAIRAIVGCGTPARSSYYEELKALYLFIGIEPASSFTDPSDLVDFHNKLRFLKSVIGLR